MLQAKDLSDREFLYGHKACPGCALGIIGRLTTKVLGEKTVITLPASCMSSVTTIYPQMSYNIPSLTAPFAATGAILNGLAAGFKAQGVKDATVLGIAGDGGTADIGIQALSGAIEQGRDFIYICYDNEAYMNTGIQRSGLTPLGASTTTSPVGKKSFGEAMPKKKMFEIMMAHRIPYAATACTSYADDLVNKLQKAKQIEGPAFLHILAPCPTGWGFDASETLEIGKLAVECGFWSLMEYLDGKVIVNKTAKTEPRPIEEYLMKQRRFKHFSKEELEIVKNDRDNELAVIRKWQKENSN